MPSGAPHHAHLLDDSAKSRRGPLIARENAMAHYCGGGSRMKAYRWEKRGLLPEPIYLAGRAYYYEDELEALHANRRTADDATADDATAGEAEVADV